jgi:hypothetical protein
VTVPAHPFHLSRRALTCVLALAGALSPLVAQEPVPADGSPRLVEGRVLRATAAEPAPVAGIWVVLHRVGSDWAAPLDSTRSRPDGRFRIDYRATGVEGALYFISADYAGIAYFSAPLREPVVRGEAAELYVFDTTTVNVTVRVLGRHLIVSQPRMDGHREVVEVYELANDTTVTRVSGGPAAPTFTALLPPDAEEFQAGQGDFSPGALLMEDGRLLSHAPIAPGLKQLSFSYALPPGSFPLSLPFDRPVEVMEVLVEEVAAEATGAGLVEVTPVVIEQRTFRRFLAQQVPVNAVLTVSVPAVAARPLATRHLILIALFAGGIMAMALLATFIARQRRRGLARPPLPPAPLADEPQALARAVAELDARFERQSATATTEEQTAYQLRRAQLKRRLAAALAVRKSAG